MPGGYLAIQTKLDQMNLSAAKVDVEEDSDSDDEEEEMDLATEEQINFAR